MSATVIVLAPDSDGLSATEEDESGGPFRVVDFRRGGTGEERLHGFSCDLAEARGGSVLACSRFDTLPSLLMVLALDSKSLGEREKKVFEALGEAEGGNSGFQKCPFPGLVAAVRSEVRGYY